MRNGNQYWLLWGGVDEDKLVGLLTEKKLSCKERGWGKLEALILEDDNDDEDDDDDEDADNDEEDDNDDDDDDNDEDEDDDDDELDEFIETRLNTLRQRTKLGIV